jgi:hypothetical protein
VESNPAGFVLARTSRTARPWHQCNLIGGTVPRSARDCMSLNDGRYAHSTEDCFIPRATRNDNPHPEGLNGYTTCKIVLDRGCAYSYAQGYKNRLSIDRTTVFAPSGRVRGGACSNGFSEEGEPVLACIRP